MNTSVAKDHMILHCGISIERGKIENWKYLNTIFKNQG